MYDLAADPAEQHNLLFDGSEANKPEVAAKFNELKAEIVRLQTQYKDDGQYADSSTWPKGSADGPFNQKMLGLKSIADAIELSGER